MGESDNRILFDDPTPLEPMASPLLPGAMASLFLRPRQFFSGHLALGSTPYVVFVTYVCGLAFGWCHAHHCNNDGQHDSVAEFLETTSNLSSELEMS